MSKLNEELLSAWLRISTSVINSRIVSEMSYKEALVCNILYRSAIEGECETLTATDLCIRTNMLKSQMNRTLNLLEERGLIIRRRSTVDKRQVFVTFNMDNAHAYEAQHARILSLLNHIISELGEEKAEDTIRNLVRIADIADEVLKED